MWTLRRYNNINALLSDNPDYNNYIFALEQINQNKSYT